MAAALVVAPLPPRALSLSLSLLSLRSLSLLWLLSRGGATPGEPRRRQAAAAANPTDAAAPTGREPLVNALQ